MGFGLTNNEILKKEPDGTIRVKGSRITLDTLIALFKRGETLEAIREGFPSLSPAQITQTRDWYLENKENAEDYFESGKVKADALREKIENDPQNIALRRVLRKRREQRNKS
jgi:uncharacterized protein (DUF433 family)